MAHDTPTDNAFHEERGEHTYSSPKECGTEDGTSSDSGRGIGITIEKSVDHGHDTTGADNLEDTSESVTEKRTELGKDTSHSS